jgi:uncharacterized GH25 family protein
VKTSGIRIVASAVALCAATRLPAHDLWLTTEGNGAQLAATLNFGESNRRDPLTVQRIFNVDVIDGKSVTSLRGGSFIEHQAGDGPVLVTAPFPRPGAAGLLAASYDSGYWVTTPQGMRNVSKRLYPQASASRWAVKFAKTLLGPGAFRVVLGQEMELTALQDPFSLSSGQTLQVRVQLKGRPVTDAKVRILDGMTVMDPKEVASAPTNAEGIATVELSRRGLYVLAVEYDVPGANPELADKDEYNSTLVFFLK